MVNDKQKTLEELHKDTAYRLWLTTMGLHETYCILLISMYIKDYIDE